MPGVKKIIPKVGRAQNLQSHNDFTPINSAVGRPLANAKNKVRTKLSVATYSTRTLRCEEHQTQPIKCLCQKSKCNNETLGQSTLT